MLLAIWRKDEHGRAYDGHDAPGHEDDLSIIFFLNTKSGMKKLNNLKTKNPYYSNVILL